MASSIPFMSESGRKPEPYQCFYPDNAATAKRFLRRFRLGPFRGVLH